MANHASTKTTQLYDRRRDEMSLERSFAPSNGLSKYGILQSVQEAENEEVVEISELKGLPLYGAD